MNNRLRDLKASRGGDGTTDLEDIELKDSLRDLEEGVDEKPPVPEDSQFVDTFYAEVAKIRQLIELVNNQVVKLEQTYTKSFTAIKNEKKVAENKKKINELQENIDASLNETKASLLKMHELNRELKKEKSESAEVRMRENQHAQLTDSMLKALETYNQVQAACKQKYEDTLVRQVKVAAGDQLTEEEAIQLVKEGGIQEENLFKHNLLNIKKHTLTGHTVNTIEAETKETLQDLKRLESSMDELQEMFQDLHALIMMQGDLLDNIEINVEKSIDYMEKGIDNIKSAKKIASKTRTTACCIGIVAAVIGIVLLVVFVALGLGLGFGVKWQAIG
jgi:t-SNARE complex subunit (syntaxin)